MFHPDSNFVKDGQNKKSGGPYTDGDKQFIDCWNILNNFVSRRRDKPTKNKADPLIQPKSEENRGASNSEPEIALLSSIGIDKQGDSDKEQGNKGPHERHQIIIHMAMMLKAKEQVLESVHMSWNVGIKADKKFQADEEHIGNGSINDDRHHFIQRFLA